MNKGMHGYSIKFTEDVPDLGIYKDEQWLEQWHTDEEETDEEYYYFDTYLAHLRVPKKDEGKYYVRVYHEGRANWLNKEYVPALMTEYRLNRKRAHSVKNPDGRTAELMAHIDYQASLIQQLEAELLNHRVLHAIRNGNFTDVPKDRE